MRHAAKAFLLASTLAAALQTGHGEFAIAVSAFNCTSCSSVRIADNATGDLDPAVGGIDFVQPASTTFDPSPVPFTEADPREIRERTWAKSCNCLPGSCSTQAPVTQKI